MLDTQVFDDGLDRKLYARKVPNRICGFDALEDRVALVARDPPLFNRSVEPLRDPFHRTLQDITVDVDQVNAAALRGHELRDPRAHRSGPHYRDRFHFRHLHPSIRSNQPAWSITSQRKNG